MFEIYISLFNPRFTIKMVESTDKYICVYPAYINSKKTIVEGRRIAKDKCVENPTVNEIRDVVQASGLKVLVENKLYCRELYQGDVLVRGRVKVQLYDDNHTPINEKIEDRKALLLHLASMIPKLKSRIQKTGSQEQTQKGGKKSQKKRR